MVFWEMVEFRSIRSPRTYYNNTCRVVLISSLNSLEMQISSKSIKKLNTKFASASFPESHCVAFTSVVCNFLPDNIS